MPCDLETQRFCYVSFLFRFCCILVFAAGLLKMRLVKSAESCGNPAESARKM